MKKICAIITARPSYSRIKSLLYAINENKKLELQIITTSSANLKQFGNVSAIIEKDGFYINKKIFNVISGDNLEASAKTTGLAIIELASALEDLKPDAVITIADRYETIANAIASSYLNIPLVHLQGGDVTGNIDEKVRHAITKLADIHFTTCKSSYERVIKLGEDPKCVFMLGCPSIDIIKKLKKMINIDFNSISNHIIFGNIKKMPKEYYILMQHPTTSDIKNNSDNMKKTLLALQKLNKPVFIMKPNSDAGSEDVLEIIKIFIDQGKFKEVVLLDNLEPEYFIRFLNHARCLIGNSSTGIRECAYLGVPVVNIGDRQENRERGNNVIDVDYCTDDIYNAVMQWQNSKRPLSSDIYGDGNAGKKIANALTSIEISYKKRLAY